MNQFLRSVAVEILALGRAYPTSLTDKKSLQALVRKLSPTLRGGDLIRLGPKGDGGYLVPDDLAGVEACFSPGAGLIAEFEKECAELGMKVFLADASVDKPAASHPLFHFTKKHVGAITNDSFMTVDDWVTSSLPGSATDLMLQIDIEGYEYETFLSISDSLMRRFRIIVAEFHNLDGLWNQPFFRLASRGFEKILQTHTCVHIHPNNCCGAMNKAGIIIPRVAEFTFLRNDRLRQPTCALVFPHPLDFDNTSNPPLALPACWYKAQ